MAGDDDRRSALTTARDGSGEGFPRRTLLAVGAAGALLATGSEITAARPLEDQSRAGPQQQLLDRFAIAELIQRERSARDNGLWNEMAACYHPDAYIETSWFKGSGKEFVAATQRALSGSSRISLHNNSLSVVTLGKGRALAETGCELVAFGEIEGAEISIVNYTRLLWRIQPFGQQWRIKGLRVIYIRDILLPCNPNRAPKLDDAELERYRRSYRYLSYMFARTPHPARDDLPGIDIPDGVARLRAEEAHWLKG